MFRLYREAGGTLTRMLELKPGMRNEMSENEAPTRTPLVLIANDQEWSARSLESILGPRGYAVLRAYTGRQALSLARGAQPDAVILDVRLPDLDGTDVCRALIEDERLSRTVPIIMTTSSASGRDQRMAAYRAGAWDFCAQPLDGEILLVKLDAFIRSKREADRLREASLLDQRSGLYNARGLARRAVELGADASRRHAAIACVAFAPDTKFPGEREDRLDEVSERITDEVSSVFRATGRQSDVIGRLSQTEFAVIAPSTEASGAAQLAERMRRATSGLTVSVDGEERPVTLRAGYSAVKDFASASVDAVELLVRATTALRHVRAETSDTYVRAFEELALSPE